MIGTTIGGAIVGKLRGRDSDYDINFYTLGLIYGLLALIFYLNMGV
jgi:hypothetical protein